VLPNAAPRAVLASTTSTCSLTGSYSLPPSTLTTYDPAATRLKLKAPVSSAMLRIVLYALCPVTKTGYAEAAATSVIMSAVIWAARLRRISEIARAKAPNIVP